MAGSIQESDEDNNCGAWTAVTVSAPDLIVGTLAPDGITHINDEVSPATATVGDAQKFTATVKNIGTASTGTQFRNVFQIDNDTTHTAVFASVVDPDKSPALGISETDSTSVSRTFSTPGTWYVRACADNNAAMVGTINEVFNEGNNCGAWTTVTVAYRPVTVVLTADGLSESSIPAGGTSKLEWGATNATSCSAIGGWTADTGTSGFKMVQPPATRDYQINCTGLGLPGSSQATVTVLPAELKLTATPPTVDSGLPVLIKWWSEDGEVSNCSVTGPDLSSADSSGSKEVTITQESTYLYSCTSAGQIVSKSVTVRLTASFIEF